MVLIHCNIIDNDYQQDSKVFYTFVPNKLFGQLLDISLKNYFFKNFKLTIFIKDKIKMRQNTK